MMNMHSLDGKKKIRHPVVEYQINESARNNKCHQKGKHNNTDDALGSGRVNGLIEIRHS